MNEIVNNFLLPEDKFMPEMHLKQLGFTYSARGPFTKNKERIQKFKGTVDTRYIYKSELDKASFQHDTADGDFKDLAKRTASDKVLRYKAFNTVLLKILNMMDIKGVLVLWLINFLIKSQQAVVLLCCKINN